MKVAILGASGYVGHNLIHKLLQDTDYSIVALSLNASRMPIEHNRLEKRDVNVFDTSPLATALTDCDVAVYLVHMMAQKKLDFAEAEAKAAESFSEAAKQARVKRVIYLGGLGNDEDGLSKHLASRHHTGEILRQNLPQVIEFRASMIIGEGSVSYDIIANLVHKLPILTLPKWAKTLTQPIGLADALRYLAAAITVPLDSHEIIEIGGPEQMSYKELMKRYEKWKGTDALMIMFPVIPVSIAAWWLNLFTPKKHAKVGRAMVESLANPMVVTNNRAQELFPDIKPLAIDDVFV